MLSPIRKLLVSAALSLAFASAALADPITVTPSASDSSVSAMINSSNCSRWFGCWIDVELAGSLGSLTADLSVGDSFEFDFFQIFVGGLGVVTDATIQATLGFLDPLGASSQTGTGGFGTFFGLVSGGWLSWGEPGHIDLGDGTWLSVQFEDLLVGGLGNHTMVSATVGWRHGAVSVPEPGTLSLLGFGLLAIWVSSVGRRRRIAV